MKSDLRVKDLLFLNQSMVRTKKVQSKINDLISTSKNKDEIKQDLADLEAELSKIYGSIVVLAYEWGNC